MTMRKTILSLGCTGALAAGTAYLMETQFAPNGVPGGSASVASAPAASGADRAPLVIAAARPSAQTAPNLPGRANSAPPSRPTAAAAAEPVVPEIVIAAAPEMPTPAAESPVARGTSFASVLPRAAGLVPAWPGQGESAEMGLVGLVRVGLDAVREAATGTGSSGASCTPQLTLAAVPGAMIDVSVAAPCHPSQRVVLRHGGLALTVATDASGGASALIPAFDAAGGVIATLSGNAVAVGGVAIPDLDAFERVALQWQGQDEFVLHAYVGDAGFGEPGHVWSGAPDGQGQGNAFVVSFDGGGVEWPLRAEVLSWLRGAQAPAIEVEAPITAGTCGREMIGESLVLQRAGSVLRADTADVTVAMPGCSAVGGFVVLHNLIPEPSISSN